ncbi:MAG: hypothetical protein GY757_57825, partial [bacterium]|nr:hypothetical protein [bacterium]
MKIDALPFKANYFWSYKKNADLPESLVAERVLIYGDFEDIFSLEREVGLEVMVKVWNEKIRGKSRYCKLNTVLELMYGESEFNTKYAPANLEN